MLHELQSDLEILTNSKVLSGVQRTNCLNSINGIRGMFRKELAEILLSNDNDRYVNFTDRQMEDNPQ